MASSESSLSVDEASDGISAVIDEVASAVIVERDLLENVMMSVLARGHVLLEDVPGTGKTITAQSIATALGLSFNRIQFTPDLLPNDVVGTNIFNEKERIFEFSEGPIFANVILADEINRAPPKTQAAMLEAMEEGQVTVEGETRDLPKPFFVIATQNPVEQEGTFPLPEAQVDRFMVKNSIGYPDLEGENEILFRRAGRTEQAPSVDSVLSGSEVLDLQQVPESVSAEEGMVDYISRVARATREDHRTDAGVSPRGTQRLFEAARAQAVVRGREYITPDDVKDIAVPVLAHRLVLTAEAQVNDVEKSAVVEEVLDEMSVPTVA